MFPGLTFDTGQPIDVLVSEEDCVSHFQLASVACSSLCTFEASHFFFFPMTQPQKHSLLVQHLIAPRTGNDSSSSLNQGILGNISILTHKD